jgi:hypothetical protein
MTLGEEVVEDYVATRLTLRAHPMALLRHILTPGTPPHESLATGQGPGVGQQHISTFGILPPPTARHPRNVDLFRGAIPDRRFSDARGITRNDHWEANAAEGKPRCSTTRE